MTAEALRFKQLIAKAAAGALLDQDEAGEAFAVMMAGGATPAQIAGFLMALRVRGETVEEITAGALSLRQRMTPITAPESAIDTCGTGGDAARHLQHLAPRPRSSSPAPACRWPSTAIAACPPSRARPRC